MSILTTLQEQGLNPDVIDDSNPDDIYLGFFKYDRLNSPNHCLIKRIVKETINEVENTVVKFPFGRFDFNRDWSERKEYLYAHRDFPVEFTKYGYYYNWHAGTDVRGICPVGYHVPTIAEIVTLFGVNPSNIGNEYQLLTSKYDPQGWVKEPIDEIATNELGFSAVPAGWRQYGLYSATDFGGQTALSNFMVTDESGIYTYYGSIAANNYMTVGATAIPKKVGLPIRAIKDTAEYDADEIVYDADGNQYTTCLINGQVWLAQNLKAKHYRNGDEIPTVTDMEDWSELTTGAKCAYNNEEKYV